MTLRIINRINECRDGRQRGRSLERLDYVVLHRIDTLGETAPEICRRFQTDPELAAITGGENPYTLFVRRDGVIEQACPLVEHTAHARRFNSVGIGIALIGDFRHHAPTGEQWLSALQLVSRIQLWRPVQVVGHDELPGASKDPAKRCPGDYFDMLAFRAEVALMRIRRAEGLLTSCGVVF